MSAQTVLFSRRYRAALLDYLLGSGETGLSYAYDLGRTAIDEGLGLLQISRAHQRALNAILESTHNVNEFLKRLKAAEGFSWRPCHRSKWRIARTSPCSRVTTKSRVRRGFRRGTGPNGVEGKIGAPLRDLPASRTEIFPVRSGRSPDGRSTA